MHKFNKILIITIVAAFTFGCASRTADTAFSNGVYDPYEKTNRAIFKFNQGADKYVFKPVAKGYRGITNEYTREKVSNFLSNIKEPVRFANQVLQSKFVESGTTLSRFAVNTTVGVLGFNDPATEWELKKGDEDFGQTLASWGVGSGNYIVVPLLGPSTPRHLGGRVIDTISDPVYISKNGEGDGKVNTYKAYRAANVISKRENMLDSMDKMERESDDYYATLRDKFTANRMKKINDEDDDFQYYLEE